MEKRNVAEAHPIYLGELTPKDGKSVRSVEEIEKGLADEEQKKAEYWKQHPSGGDGSGGFYCEYMLNCLREELRIAKEAADGEA